MIKCLKCLLFVTLFAFSVSGILWGLEGRIYFVSNRFSGDTAAENTGTCVYDGQEVVPLFRYYTCAGVSKDGKRLVARLENKRRTVAVMDLVTNEAEEFYIPNCTARKYEFFPNDNERFVYVGADAGDEEKSRRVETLIWNLYSFDTQTQEKEKLTSYGEQGRRITSFSTCPAGENIVYSVGLGPEIRDGRVMRIMDLKTGKTEELPFTSLTVAWSPKGDTIAMQGYMVDDERSSGGSRIILYDVETGQYEKLDKPGGNDAYLWEAALTYSPDGERIAFIRHENNGAKTLWTMNADGSDRQLILSEGYYKGYLSWSE